MKIDLGKMKEPRFVGRQGKGAMRKHKIKLRNEAWDRQVKYFADHGQDALDPDFMLPESERIENRG